MLKLSIYILIFYAINNVDCKSIKPLSDKGREIWFNETIPSSKFGASGFGGSWISGTEFTYTNNRELVKFDVVTKQNSTLYPSTFAPKWRSSSLQRSPTGTHVLIRYEPRAIFRHSTVARFSVVSNDDLNVEFKIRNGTELQLCKFSPNGDRILYIFDNTIYSVPVRSLSATSQNTGTRISPFGIPGVEYYGIPDWVYEEEVLGSDAAAWFNEDGNYLAYAYFNDTDVPDFTYELYGEGDARFQYPEEVHLRYPKVGEVNPDVQMYLFDFANMDTLFLSTPLDKVSDDHILGTVFWISNRKLGAIWMNRRQNKGVITSYTYVSADSFEMATIAEINEPDGWIELDTPKCEADGICYFINNANNWPSLTKIDTNTNTLTPLTSNKHVFSYLGSRNGKIYYSATPGQNESFNRHTYVLDNGVEKCLTCEIVTPEKNKCTYATTSFSTDLSHYALTCSGPDVSFTDIYETDSSTKILEWRTNAQLRTMLEGYELPKIKIFHVTVGGKYQAPVKMLVPPEIDLDDIDKVTAKYPLLIRVYGGPGSVRISNTFSVGYQSYQVTSKKMIYAEIDGRGTGQKGVDMMFSINNRLGTYEMEDQIAVTKYLVDNFKFIDKERVSIWGWSYGGYATAMTLAKDTEKVFKCGVSVAPVTSWIFYDTIYTERYMGVDPYSAQYNNSDVSTPNHIKVIGQHDFFLIHGNADDNVHYQQSMVLAGALEKADILFEQMSYPDEAHALSGVSLHLYHSLDRFWDKCFKL
ncbi:venom dipeptidyl peptidase 4 [Chironomus tepperi]|uniref:venom dipeptidyl peptidase 4 n=1 Tax=Chironomus tepperi TaxID=113505 RepID=UPI00391EE608